MTKYAFLTPTRGKKRPTFLLLAVQKSMTMMAEVAAEQLERYN